eukprot:2565503-Pleurochrysis_carterae.AAC.1
MGAGPYRPTDWADAAERALQALGAATRRAPAGDRQLACTEGKPLGSAARLKPVYGDERGRPVDA